MIIAPFWAFGLVLIFFVGFATAGVATDATMKRKRTRTRGWASDAQKQRDDRISTAAGVAGGMIAVVIACLPLLLLPKDKVFMAWMVLAAIGALFVGAWWLLMSTMDS